MSAFQRLANRLKLIVADLVGASIETQAVSGDGRRLVLRAASFDGQGNRGMVGVIIGVESETNDPVKFTSGDFNYSSDPDVANVGPRYIPIVIQQGSAQMFAGPHTTRFYAGLTPHLNLFAAAGAGVVIDGDNIGWFDEGAPDVQGDITVLGRNLGRYINDSLAVGDSIWFGDGPGAGNFIAQLIDATHGSSGMTAKAGEVRRGFNELAGVRHEIINIDGAQNQPQHFALQAFMNFDPPNQAYAPGVTVVKSYFPNDFGYENMSSFLMYNFNLPPALVNGGGQLNPGFKLIFNTGSFHGPIYNTNTAARLFIERESFAINGAGSYIVEVQMLVNNTGALVTDDLDYFQIDAAVI